MRGVHLSKLYSFSCLRSLYSDEHDNIGEKGYSRIVYCNDPDNADALQLRKRPNYVSTTKYTIFSFIPKSLFEQFRRVANIYFLVVACVSFSPLAAYTALSVLGPLVVVIGATMAKEGVEDWRRRRQVNIVADGGLTTTSLRSIATLITYCLIGVVTVVFQDIEANNRKVKVYGKNQTFQETRWKKLRAGDLVKIYKDDYFPADLLLLSSSYEDGICYVETMNLDGETNLKLKHALEITASLQDDNSFKHFKAVIKCEDPNEDLYSFVGSLSYNGRQNPVSLKQFLLRDSKLRNTEYIYGVVVFTGHDTKVMQNATDPPSKRSKVERRMDKIIYILFSILILISSVGSVFFWLLTKKDIHNGELERWYLRPDDISVLFDPERASLAAFFHFLTGIMLYGYLIPISLYVSIELVKVLQSIFINRDRDMYDEETDKPAHARTSNLNEELGQIDIILSDKTGTLTCNSMEFVKCSIAGVGYGRGMTEVERALTIRRIYEQPEIGDGPSYLPESSDAEVKSSNSVKGFNFQDERIVDGQWVNEPHADMIEIFFRALAICHTAIPDVDEQTGKISYEAESPDEAAFVISARELGFEFYKRTQTILSLHELDPSNGTMVDRSYELLHVLEFSSSRKRMSVIVKDDNKLLLLCKGADSVMFERLSNEGRVFESKTKEHISQYARAGLRTLVVAYRQLDEEEYYMWADEFFEAKTSLTADRDKLVDAAADKIEINLFLLGATAVEDKLQKGVPECIDKLAKAGIKLWILTGDKMETAINIGYACGLLRQGMKKIVISLDNTRMDVLERQGDKEMLAKASHESIGRQIQEGRLQLRSLKESPATFCLIIDGKSLTFALNNGLEHSFLGLALNCASVICCRSSPKQKALVTRLVKVGTASTILAIGDGANDVGMLQEADIGVGITGLEGMQAAMSSDFSIAQFCFLERLLLVHGHWCYRRIVMMICYFFYKNITFGLTLFWFEAYASFSGQPAYNDWYMSFYNVFFTSLPVIALGVFDQDVSARLCLKYPLLYQEGVENILFSWPRILGWMFNGFISSVIIFYFTTNSITLQAFRSDGHVVDYEIYGVTMYTCVVWVVNCQMAISINYFTWIQHFFIWGSIAFWYAFLVIYGSLPSTYSTTAYKVLVEACAPSPFFWLVTLLVVASTLVPYFTYRAFQTRFCPMYHDIVQKNRSEGLETTRTTTPAKLSEQGKDLLLSLD